MPFIDADAPELNAKVVCYGPPLAGKSASLSSVHSSEHSIGEIGLSREHYGFGGAMRR